MHAKYLPKATHVSSIYSNLWKPDATLETKAALSTDVNDGTENEKNGRAGPMKEDGEGFYSFADASGGAAVKMNGDDDDDGSGGRR